MTQDTEKIFPALRWLDAQDNIFNIPCIDVRGLTKTLTSYTSDEETAVQFSQWRKSTGIEYRDRLPDGAVGTECNLQYPASDFIIEGPLYKARSMEEKWDIYHYDGHLYFCRSWTGNLALHAIVKNNVTGGMEVIRVDANPNSGFGEPGFAISTVDYLIKSHLFGLDIPVHLPECKFDNPMLAMNYLTNESVEIAKYLFHEFGRHASFGSYSETTNLPVQFERSEIIGDHGLHGLKTLKPKISLTDDSVECPVIGCKQSVTRQRNEFKKLPEFCCPDHRICISPSTFEYPEEADNLLWRSDEDISLLKRIFKVKREHRMARDNSEDALTWNLFRYLETNQLLTEILSKIHGRHLDDVEVFYWTFDPSSSTSWGELTLYQDFFGEKPNKGSEPDLIIRTNEALFFIEAKLTASHNTKPTNLAVAVSYTQACHQWYERVFRADFKTVAEIEKKYELLRFWLIGSRMADRSDRAFYLVTIGRGELSQKIKEQFGELIVENVDRHFISLSWEDFYQYIVRCGPSNFHTELLLAYFENKTIGYNHTGKLQKAFEI